jgi:hypothetical protein
MIPTLADKDKMTLNGKQLREFAKLNYQEGYFNGLRNALIGIFSIVIVVILILIIVEACL